jgi:hypothetical protein
VGDVRDRLRRAALILGTTSFLALGLVAACGGGTLLQGDDYALDGAVRAAPLRDRPDGTVCDGGGCASDAAVDAPRVEVREGAAPPANTCETARDVGSLAADQGSASLDVNGKCSEWLSVRATEDNSGVFGAPMKLVATLTPNGHDFDLYGFVNADRDVRSCVTQAAESRTPGDFAVETIGLTWGEGTVANGSDDSRTVTLLVQAAPGPCGDGGWRMKIEGSR